MRRAALLVAAAALVAGCGGGTTKPAGPKLPHAVAQRLLAALDDPGALQAEAIRDVNRHRVPPALQEPLLSLVNALHAAPTAARRRQIEGWLRDNSR